MPEYVRDLGETLHPFLSLLVLQHASSAYGLSDRNASLCSLTTLGRLFLQMGWPAVAKHTIDILCMGFSRKYIASKKLKIIKNKENEYCVLNTWTNLS